MSTRERLTLAAALAVALGTAALAPLYDDLLWLPRVLGAIAVIAAAGLVCRRLNVPALLQPVLAVAALFEFVTLTFVRSTTSFGVLPTGRTIPALRALVDEGLSDIERLAPPVPTHPGLTLMAVLGVAAVALVVDVIAVLLARAAVAGLPLLVLFAVPSAVRPGGVGWLPFALGAAGWLALLLVEGGDRVGRWGTPLKAARPERGAVYEDTSLGRVGRRIGAAALGVAVVVPAMIPGLDTRLLGGGDGMGFGEGGSRTTTTYNPITKLRNDLRQPTPRPVLSYETDDPTPDYLRLTTLDRFTDAGWSASKLTGSTERDGVKDRLPRPVGLDGDPLETQTRITIRGLDAQWLPTPFPPREVDVRGPWLYDARSETIFGIRVGTRRLKDSYTVRASEVAPDREVLAAALDTGLPTDVRQYALMPTVTNAVKRLTDQVVAGQTTPYGKVAAIQRFFTDPRSNFEYSTSSQVQGIESPSALADFLKFRKGFCEQYASAMAAMIRLTGVPARVAVGFTAGTRQPGGAYLVTTGDAHAWPEAWFAGTGWVRFEPTPRDDGQTVVPGYAQAAPTGPAAGGPDLPAPAPGEAEGEAADGANGVNDKLDRLDQDPGEAVAAEEVPAESEGSSLPPLWAVAGLGVAVVALLPWLLHALRHRRRWSAASSPGALTAWQQVCDDGVDAGHVWRGKDSPRAAAAHLASTVALPAEAAAALNRLAVAAERVRYAREGAGGDVASLRADAGTVRSALLASVSARRRWQARLAPPSTLRWASSASGTFVADVLDGFDSGWARVRRALRVGARTA